MNVYDAMFMLQFFAFVGIFLFWLYNVMRLGEFFDISWGFVLLSLCAILWLVGFVALASYPEKLLFSTLHTLQGWLLPVNVLFLIIQIFLHIRDGVQDTVKAYRSWDVKPKSFYSQTARR